MEGLIESGCIINGDVCDVQTKYLAELGFDF
jgi:hypothetical protein